MGLTADRIARRHTARALQVEPPSQSTTRPHQLIGDSNPDTATGQSAHSGHIDRFHTGETDRPSRKGEINRMEAGQMVLLR